MIRVTPGYGFKTVMLVPLLSPSGSWLRLELYVFEAWVTVLTVNVVLTVAFGRLPVCT